MYKKQIQQKTSAMFEIGKIGTFLDKIDKESRMNECLNRELMNEMLFDVCFSVRIFIAVIHTDVSKNFIQEI